MKTAFKQTSVLLILLFCFLPVFSQSLSKKGFIKAVQQADIFYYYDQNYEKAASLYESLLKIYPKNSNLEAKLGICYLNLDGKNPDALKLLSDAASNVVRNDKEYLEYGDKAPLDTYLYLAIAYHQNDSLQKAIAMYADAKKLLSGTKAFREEYIDSQILDCRYAIEMKKKPLPIHTKLFTPWLSNYPGACNPVLSKNDSVFIFTQLEDGKTRIMCSYKSGSWQKPTDITRQLGGYDLLYSNSITGDGKLLIIYMDDSGKGNLYFSQRTDSTWSKIKSIGKPICTNYWQSHGFITADGKAMYFSSNRPGGEGELDIWYSERKADGKWSEPVNCGNTINTPYNEDTPFFDQQTDALIFSSVGHASMGGYDVFRSFKKNGTWTNPVGMPYALNNVLQNSFFILNNNKPGFITSLYDEKEKSRNIYTINAEDPAEKITFVIGRITLQDGMAIDPEQIKIWLVNSNNESSQRNIVLSDSTTFKFEIKPGEYRLFISHKKYKTDTINLNLPLYYPSNYITLSAALVPEKVFEGEFLSVSTVLFDYNKSDLSEEAKSGLEKLKNILIAYPELKVEVAGYTDSKGSREYNQVLADQRAQAVIDYLSTEGMPRTRFIKKAFGKSDYVAVNTNSDGSDNPEGRKYNRRVTFGVVDPKTGIIIRQETYTPEHLRQPYSIRYSIVLLKTGKKLSPSYFAELTKDGPLFIRTIKADTLSIYSLGVFYNKTDALRYLDFVRGKGFTKAYILNQYDLEKETDDLITPDQKNSALNKIDRDVYTIQLKATQNPLNVDQVFSDLEGVNEIRASDGLYKYYYGEYKSLSKAKEALLSVKRTGFEDAFIRNLYLLMAQ